MFNTGAEHIFGYAAREVLGRPLEILLPERHRNTHRKHIADFEADSNRLRAMGTHRQEIFGLRKDGREFPAEASISKLEQDGEFLLTALLADVTERTAAERALQDSNRRLEETLAELRATRDQIVQQVRRLKALGTMASGIAHDFNNMLLPIVAFANLLLAKDKILEDRDRTRQYLGMIRIAGIDAADVVGRQREFYRGHDAPETFSLGDLPLLVKNVVALTRPKWWDQAQATGVDIGIRIAMGGPKFVPADESGLRSLLTDLVFNAVDAMPGGGKITIQSRLDGCRLVLEIGDTGIDMSEETRRRCPDPFFTTKGDQGAGHGLAIVHGIVQRHAGSIDIASESGKGTAVSIRLPAPEQAASAPIVGGQGPHVAAALRILLVNDDPSALVAVCELLEPDDNTVVTASSGSGALDRFVPGNTEVVMTDRAMPDVNGDKLANAIKLAAPATPVIMLTGFGDMMEADDERSENVDLILRKPVALLLLRKALVEVTAQ